MKNLPLFIPVVFAAVSLFAQPVESGTRKQSFDRDWRFEIGDSASFSDPAYQDAGWRLLDLPHDWSIEGAIKKENPMGLAGGFFPSGLGWYRKTFEVPADWENKQVSIYFEGVYMNSEVFINGYSLGVHPYGYTSFAYELTPHLKFGAGETNVLAVRVDNSQQQNCRWYSGSGIYRHVWLLTTEVVHIPLWGIGITTPKVHASASTVQVSTQVKNGTDATRSFEILVNLVDGKGHEVGSQWLPLQVPAHEIREVSGMVNLDAPQLWTPEHPYLYIAHVSVAEGEKVWDELDQQFGIRSIAFSADNGFQLNGEPVLLNGGCVHHDNGSLGAAAYDRAEIRRVELLKTAGFNAIRTSHNPPSEAFLDACDRLGLMVIDEAFDGWKTEKTPHDYARFFDANWRSDLEAMVLRDRNHPAVILWSHGNEILERTSPEAVRTARMLTDYIHQLDPTRPVTSALTTWGQGWENFDPLAAAHDVVGYNYQLFRAEDDHQRVPDRIIVNTESYPIDAFKTWDLVERNPYIIGDFVWTALDYLGESSIGRTYYPGEPEGEHWQNDFYPWHGAYCGDIDLTGWRKPISHYRSMLYNRGEHDEKLYMAVREPSPETGLIKLTQWAVWPTWQSWTWPGHEGKAIEVEIYSLHPKVRLYVNDRLVGQQTTARAQEFKAVFTLSYEPGILKTVALDEAGHELESRTLLTAGDAHSIALIADREEIIADGQDLTFVTVEVLDAQGYPQPNAEDLIEFSIEGPGTIQAVDNGNLKNEEPYFAKSRHAWNGRAMVVVRSGHEAGDITLKAKAGGLQEASVVIRAK